MGKLLSEMNPFKGFWIYCLAIPLVVIIIDQWTKYKAIKFFKAPMNICEINPMPGLAYEFSPIVDLALVCNQGISWGLLQGDSSIKRWGLTVFAALMCGVLIYVLAKSKDWMNRLSIALIIGGAIGNGIDRALFGAVTDFINFSDIGFKWVFNVADSAISVGVIGLILASFIYKDEAED